ncbi:MAG: hypothetical protein M3067_15395 [Chloroflexota bacterium]|nr:hypothetical protein [Chloroflexota bacterium]
MYDVAERVTERVTERDTVVTLNTHPPRARPSRSYYKGTLTTDDINPANVT